MKKMKNMKSIIILSILMLCIAGLGSVINIKADEYVYDNDSDVSIKSNIDGQKWDLDSTFLLTMREAVDYKEDVLTSIGGASLL